MSFLTAVVKVDVAAEADRGRGSQREDTTQALEVDRQIGRGVEEMTAVLAAAPNCPHVGYWRLGRQHPRADSQQDCHLDCRIGSQGQAVAQGQRAEAQEHKRLGNSPREVAGTVLAAAARETGIHLVHSGSIRRSDCFEPLKCII